MTRGPGENVTSDAAPEPVGAYPHAKRVGPFLFLSGLGPRVRGAASVPGVTVDADGEVAAYDIARQCHAVFANLRTILADAGASWDDIVDVTVFLTDLKADFDTFNRIYAEYFVSNQPTRTTLGVTRLPTPIAIELKVIAAIG